jgi:ABC-type polysaccharide/polyol phosphate export permease
MMITNHLQQIWSQTVTLTEANLKARYRKTLAGFLWVVLSPLISYSVQCYVFRTVLRMQVQKYPVFLLSGLLPWIFISQSIDMCTSIFVQSGGILKSYPVNPLVYLVAQLLDNAFNFFAAFFLILAFVLAASPFDWSRLALLPIAMLPLFLATFGMTWLFATFHVFFRDTKFILSLVISTAFFITPVFYPVEYVPAQYRWIVDWNPLNYLIVPFRAAVLESPGSSFPLAILQAGLVAAGFTALAAFYWHRKRNLVYLYI